MTDAWIKLIISWSPFLLLILFWIYFMKKMRASRQGELIERTFKHYDRVEALLERIAVGLERTTPPDPTTPKP
jgi:ATP-dependent Zn protease